jgi:glycosyltransferase involved in cell wall biosynthesis
MNQPLISICIPTYNGETYIRECLDSVLAQSYTNTEVIIVDDLSTDSTVEIVHEYLQKDTRIRLYKNDFHLGLVGNWNKCFELAKGEWMKFAFQDDLLAGNCLEVMMAAAEDHSFVVCDRDFIFDDSVSEKIKSYYNEELITLRKLVKTDQNIFLSDKDASGFITHNISYNFIGEPTVVLFRKNIIQEVGYFNSDLSQVCDLEYWLRIITLKGFVYVPQTLASFRIHAASTTSQNITGKKKPDLNYWDVIVFCHELLFNDLFAHFRKLIGRVGRQKIVYYLKVNLYEVRMAYKKDNSCDHTLADKFLLKYPALNKFYIPSICTKIVHRLLVLKRKLK